MGMQERKRPLNLHRWRKLEGSNPQLYAMIGKVHELRKRVIQANTDVANRDALIQQKEKLFVDLKGILARQPGPEVVEQLAVYQQSLKQKQKQLKAMTMELNMYKVRVYLCGFCRPGQSRPRDLELACTHRILLIASTCLLRHLI